MAWAYSVDLRERVVGAFELGDMTDHDVAELFGVGEATVHRWKRLKRETGSLESKPHGGGNPPLIGQERWDLVKTIVQEQPDRTLREIADEVLSRTGQKVSRPTMCRVLAKLGLARKKSP